MTLSAEPRSLNQLIDLFYRFLGGELKAGRNEQRTLDYYHAEIGKWSSTLPADFPLADLRPFHLTGSGGVSWHRIQAVQRLFNWSDDQGLFGPSPFRKVKRPRLGERERVLTPAEESRLLRSAPKRIQWVILFLLRSLCRPGELRALQWRHLVELPGKAGGRTVWQFALPKFKGKKRRQDGAKLRIIPLDDVLVGLLAKWRRERNPAPEDYIFLNRRGLPWTKDAIGIAFRKARQRAGLDGDGERIVAYSCRHTGATRATINGVRDKMLSSIMGHADPRMVAKYQHFDANTLSDAIQLATKKSKR